MPREMANIIDDYFWRRQTCNVWRFCFYFSWFYESAYVCTGKPTHQCGQTACVYRFLQIYKNFAWSKCGRHFTYEPSQKGIILLTRGFLKCILSFTLFGLFIEHFNKNSFKAKTVKYRIDMLWGLRTHQNKTDKTYLIFTRCLSDINDSVSGQQCALTVTLLILRAQKCMICYHFEVVNKITYSRNRH